MSISSSDYSNTNESGVLKSNFICILSILLFAMGFPAAEYLLDDWDVVSSVAGSAASSSMSTSASISGIRRRWGNKKKEQQNKHLDA